MAHTTENLDFSGLFKLDVLLHLDITNYSFYEVGLRKYLTLTSDKELIFLYINPDFVRFEKNYEWDFIDNPIYCMCFEPSGTWVIILSDQKVLLVPFLPLFIPQNTFDQKWSLNSVTVLPIAPIPKPTSTIWWLTKESENILIIGTKVGIIIFYCMETQTIVGDCKVSGEIVDLQMCFDDSLDLLVLLISVDKQQQWKLVLEHRSLGYNWLHQIRGQDKDKRESFISIIKQFSKDKITLFTQGGTKDEKSQAVEYLVKPAEYLPSFRTSSNNWALTAQYVNGRHFLTAIELNEGTMLIESPEEDTPSRTLIPRIKKDGLYIQGLWTQRLIYMVKKNEIEVHSSNFSTLRVEPVGSKTEVTKLWSAELIGDVIRVHLLSPKHAPAMASGWREPTFLCDLQLPRFNLEPCLIITNCGAYILNTVSEPCEWLVGVIMRGGVGAEQAANALGAPVPLLLKAAADMLMSRGKIAPAHYLYTLSQSKPDGWVGRLGIFGRLHELSMYKQTGKIGSLGNSAITTKLLALLLKIATNYEEKFEPDVKYVTLETKQLKELTSIAAAIGLWKIVPVFSMYRGQPNLILAAIQSRSDICRGALNCLLDHKCLVPLLLEENHQWLFDFIIEKCKNFDTTILKRICLWLNPLQDQLRPVIRDLKQGISSSYTLNMRSLITTFMHVVCAIDARHPNPDIHLELTHDAETWKSQFVPKRAVSCGLAHWAVVDEGSAKIVMTNTTVNTGLIGRVLDVACGRHHTLILTENGVYAAGDNSFGQLGVGYSWQGAIGDAATAAGTLMHVPFDWTAPLVSIAAGHYHSAVIDAGGRLYTWGWGVHGQLGLGSIDDECSPKMVTKLQGRKVLSVGCGGCHTVMLMKNGEVWACGAAVFGQLGSGNREKSSVPIKVVLPDTIETIAVGYFHTVALGSRGSLYSWGASPQQVRAAHARASSDETSAQPPQDPHLAPVTVDTSSVSGRIVRVAAGWHHSFIINNAGILYGWGLNFDGQLGTGDRKQVNVPTEIMIKKVNKAGKSNPTTPEVEDTDFRTKALVACGGDFTIYVADDGRIYIAGNSHDESNENDKGTNRIIMMKTTKRVIKIPSRTNTKFLFQPIDKIGSMFNTPINQIEPSHNPLVNLNDFNKSCWADDVVLMLKPWLNESSLASNLNMAAKLAYHNEDYAECLKMLLRDLKTVPQDDCLYITHTEVIDHELSEESTYDSRKKDELKIIITNAMSKRIKEVSIKILNDEPYPDIDPVVYETLPCSCDEFQYLPKTLIPIVVANTTERNHSLKAANIIDKCMSMFPIDSKLWEICFRQAKGFFIENNLSIRELEVVLRKYMETHATTMAAAIMYSNDCAEYNEILSPKFFLNMCSQVMDTWG
ncbi:hypothetical protein ACJJTC_008888 [Scirpophaga incertulas]